jgi:hypothetical protein
MVCTHINSFYLLSVCVLGGLQGYVLLFLLCSTRDIPPISVYYYLSTESLPASTYMVGSSSPCLIIASPIFFFLFFLSHASSLAPNQGTGSTESPAMAQLESVVGQDAGHDAGSRQPPAGALLGCAAGLC